jgi:hypothetical protein
MTCMSARAQHAHTSDMLLPQVSAGQPSTGRKPPWNKGRSLSAQTRAKISLSQKRRWKKNPDLRATVGAKLQVG